MPYVLISSSTTLKRSLLIFSWHSPLVKCWNNTHGLSSMTRQSPVITEVFLFPLNSLMFPTISLRTPLCILQPPRIIATACFILAQRLEEGPNSASLNERIYSRSSASLPTPPHMHPRSPPSANFAQGFFQLSEPDMEAVASIHSLFFFIAFVNYIFFWTQSPSP